MSSSASFWMHSNMVFRLTQDWLMDLTVWFMHMVHADSIRDVIAFPKVKDASCLMTQAPGIVDEKQLEELGLEVETVSEE